MPEKPTTEKNPRCHLCGRYLHEKTCGWPHTAAYDRAIMDAARAPLRDRFAQHRKPPGPGAIE